MAGVGVAPPSKHVRTHGWVWVWVWRRLLDLFKGLLEDAVKSAINSAFTGGIDTFINKARGHANGVGDV
jgi:hypothetical protein